MIAQYLRGGDEEEEDAVEEEEEIAVDDIHFGNHLGVGDCTILGPMLHTTVNIQAVAILVDHADHCLHRTCVFIRVYL